MAKAKAGVGDQRRIANLGGLGPLSAVDAEFPARAPILLSHDVRGLFV